MSTLLSPPPCSPLLAPAHTQQPAAAALAQSLSPAKRPVASIMPTTNTHAPASNKAAKVETGSSPNSHAQAHVRSQSQGHQSLVALAMPVAAVVAPNTASKRCIGAQPATGAYTPGHGRPPPIPSPSALALSASKAAATGVATPAQQHAHAKAPTPRAIAALQTQSQWLGALAAAAGVPPSPRMGALPSPAHRSAAAPAHSPSHFALHSPAATSSPAPRHARSASASPALSASMHAGVFGGAAALHCASATATAIDRFIPARRELSLAVAHVQTRAHLDTYGEDNTDQENAGDKENEGEGGPAEARDPALLARAIHKSEFTCLLAQSLLPSPKGSPGHAAEMQGSPPHDCASMFSFASPSSSPAAAAAAAASASASASAAGRPGSSARGRLAPKSLFPVEPSRAQQQLNFGSAHSRSVSVDYQQQLSNTYRSGNSAAAAAAAGADPFAASSSSSPGHASLSSLRASSRAGPSSLAAGGLGSPSRARAADRALAARVASIPRDSVRVLDCPGLANDYYLNLLHMSERNGLLAIGLGTCVYLWNSATAEISCLGGAEEEAQSQGDATPAVTSLRWTSDGSNLAVGYSDAATKLWDVATSAPVQTLRSHRARVSCLDWNSGTSANCFVLASGGADSAIYTHDVRQHSSRSIVAHYSAHKEEVCGLAFSPDGSQLASGANDNKLCIWNMRAPAGAAVGAAGVASSAAGHLALNHHSAAVKALAWCPWQDKLLASGGGLADGHIRFCNSTTGAQTLAVDTASQVCSLQFARGGERELLSAHGHPHHSLSLWQCAGKDVSRITTLQGHTSRVLHTSLSPDGSTCISASADETLRFWKVWKPVVAKQSGAEHAFRSSPMHMRIR